jgi:DNA-directed RNA polymerase specialized sigma24 family protein
MKPATLAGIGDRQERRKFFQGDRLNALLVYLAQDGSTYQGAADKFQCAKSTVEKTVYRLRRELKKKTPAAKDKS